MKKILFTLIPLGVTFLYVIEQFGALVWFLFPPSSLYIDITAYTIFAAYYVYFGYRTEKRQYFIWAIIGFLIGIIPFVAVVGIKFMLSNLSI